MDDALDAGRRAEQPAPDGAGDDEGDGERVKVDGAPTRLRRVRADRSGWPAPSRSRWRPKHRASRTGTGWYRRYSSAGLSTIPRSDGSRKWNNPVEASSSTMRSRLSSRRRRRHRRRWRGAKARGPAAAGRRRAGRRACAGSALLQGKLRSWGSTTIVAAFSFQEWQRRWAPLLLNYGAQVRRIAEAGVLVLLPLGRRWRAKRDG